MITLFWSKCDPDVFSNEFIQVWPDEAKHSPNTVSSRASESPEQIGQDVPNSQCMYAVRYVVFK